MTINPYESPRSEAGPSPVAVGSVPLIASYDIDYRTLHFAFYRYYLIRRKGNWFTRWGGSATAAAFGIGMFAYLTKADVRVVIQISIFCTLLVIAINVRLTHYLLAGLWLSQIDAREQPGILGKHTISIANGELTEKSSVGRMSLQLNCVSAVYCFNEAIVVRLPGGTILAIPPTGDFGIDTFESFGLRLTNVVRQSKRVG